MFIGLSDFERYERECQAVSSQLATQVKLLTDCHKQIGKKYILCRKVNYNRLAIAFPFFRKVIDQLPDEKLPSIDKQGYIAMREVNNCIRCRRADYYYDRQLVDLLSKTYNYLNSDDKNYILNANFSVKVPDFLITRLRQVKQMIELENQLTFNWKQEIATANKYLFKVGSDTTLIHACLMLPNFAHFFDHLDEEKKKELESKYIGKKVYAGDFDRVHKNLFYEVASFAQTEIYNDIMLLDYLQQYEENGSSISLNEYLKRAHFHNIVPEWMREKLKIAQLQIKGEFIGPLPEKQYRKMR